MGLELRVDDIYQAPQIASMIRERLEYPYSVTDWTQMNKEIFDLMKLQKVVVFLIITLIVIVAAFNIISTLIMMVMEKEKEVGILKAMGATAGSIMKIFMWEGVIIGIIGTGLGVLVGVILASSLQQYEFISISAEVYQLNTLPVEISVMDIIVISLISFSISFLATLYPARQAAKLMPVDAIRYE
jgi:lipoprotein-releasing system permease protein